MSIVCFRGKKKNEESKQKTVAEIDKDKNDKRERRGNFDIQNTVLPTTNNSIEI
jgi:hypothetical protein